MQKDFKSSSILSYLLKPYNLLTQGFENKLDITGEALKKCVILGHGKSGGRGEELSVLILMLIPPNTNAVSSILQLCTASQVI